MSLSMNKRENCQSSKDGFDKALTLYEGRHVFAINRLSKSGGKRAISSLLLTNRFLDGADTGEQYSTYSLLCHGEKQVLVCCCCCF
jgi:hypothetical protein